MRQRWGVDAPRSNLGTGAAMADGDRAFVLLDTDHGLGAALAWARRAGTAELHVVADGDDAGTIARQAG